MTAPSLLQDQGAPELLLQKLQQALSQGLAPGANLCELLLSDEQRRLFELLQLPRRFDRSLCVELLQPAAAVASTTALDALIQTGLVQPVAGRAGWWQVSERRLAAPTATAADWAPLGPRWRQLHQELAHWFERFGADGELEALYHRLCSQEAGGEATWGLQYDAARDGFNLARCETLLQLLDECARFVSPELAMRGTRERGLLAARAAFADDHLRTSRYLERAPLLRAFEALLQDRQHFILQLHAPGGSGKTMFLRWLGPRWCLPHGVPIARVDFDFLDASERGLASAFMLGKLAERLDPQLPGAPLFELLRDVAEERRRALAQPEAFDAPALLRLEDEVRERLAGVLVERCAGQPVLLVFDTMEDAALKHQVNVMALVQAVAALRERLHALAQDGAAAPRLVLILAGRYTLAEQYPEVQQAFAAQLVVSRIEPFGADEARRYLRQRLAGCPQAPSPVVLAAVLERAHGNPFKLSLYADILLSSPMLGLAELGQGVDVDMLYLIERVLRRIPDPALRWLLRYGVLARRLTRSFVEQVLLAPLRRSLRGDRRDDDPARDGVTHRDWPRLWLAGDGAPLQAADVADLWRRLREYASASSWISVDAAGADAVVIQPTVSHAMRRALLQQDRPVVVQIHRAAIRHARRSADAAAQADLTYHDFQLRGARAARAWWLRVQAADQRAHDLDATEALAAVVLSEDLRQTELQGAAAATPLVDSVTRARALHMLARVHDQRADLADAASRASHQAQARALLAQFDAIALPAGQSAINPLRDGMLRLALLAHVPRQRKLALARLEAALAGRLDGATRAQVLLTLQRQWAETDPARACRFGQQWGQLAWRQGDAASYGEHVVEQARRLLREQQPAAALKVLIQGQADLRPGLSRQTGRQSSRPTSRRTPRWTSRSEALQARAELAGEEPGALHAAGLFDAACRRHAQLNPAGTAAAPQRTEPADRLSQAELRLVAGEPQLACELAQQVAAELGGTAGVAGKQAMPRESVLRLRVRALLVQAHAARQLLEFSSMLDLLSQTLALQSELGDHFNEVLTRLHIARVQLFDIGNLQLAGEHLQDSDTALAHEVAELRIEHRLLRAALLTLRGHDGQSLIAEAVRWLDEVPASRWRVRLHVALAGLHWGPPEQRLVHAGALADVWDRLDYVGARLMAATELRYLAPLTDVPAELATRLERLSGIEPLRLPGQQRLSAADRMRLTLQRVELLRVLGRPEPAQAELRTLQSCIARQPVGPWLRQLALCCDRLGMAADQLLPAGWLAALAQALSSAPMLLAVVQQEAAERALRAGDTRRALELLLQAQPAFDASIGLRSRWHVRQWELKLRLLDDLTEPPLQMTRQIDELQQQLGWPGSPAPVSPPPSPSPSSPTSAVAVSKVVPTAITGLRVYQPDQVQPVAYRHDGSVDDKPRLALQPRFAALLDAMAAGRISEGAAPEIVSLLGQRGLQFGRLLANAVLPTRLLERLSVVLAGQLPPQEIVVEHRQSGMHAMPWELMVPAPRQYLQLHPEPSVPGQDDRPITLHAAVRRFWRAPAHFTLRARVAWVQRALAVLGQGAPIADGQLGPATAQLLRRWQRASGVPESGWADEATLAKLARQIRPLVAPRPAPSVLLITPARETNIASQRGADVSGTSLEWTYRQHGLTVQTLDEPDAERLMRLQQAPQTRFEVVHIAAPIAQSRSSRELSLQFAATHKQSYTTAFSPSLLGRLLHDSPLVIVETPRSTSRDETIRQLLLRNAFAAQLFEHGELATVVATGLAGPAGQQALSDTLAAALAERVPPDELVQRLRQADPAGMASGDLVELIPSAGIALFARDPLIVHLPNPTQNPTPRA
jgi:hypothetical protein